jgi:hypothetical protein
VQDSCCAVSQTGVSDCTKLKAACEVFGYLGDDCTNKYNACVEENYNHGNPPTGVSSGPGTLGGGNPTVGKYSGGVATTACLITIEVSKATLQAENDYYDLGDTICYKLAPNYWVSPTNNVSSTGGLAAVQ